jgi:hypothetical protein
MVSVIIIRADKSTDPNGKIIPIESILKNHSYNNLNLVVFERSSTVGTNTHVKYKINNKVDELNMYPGYIFFTSKNKDMLDFLIEYGKVNELNIEYVLETKENDSIYFAQTINSNSDPDDLNSELKMIIDRLNFDFYYSFFKKNYFTNLSADSIIENIERLSNKYKVISEQFEEVNSTIHNSNLSFFVDYDRSFLNVVSETDESTSSFNLGYNIWYNFYPFKGAQWLGMRVGLDYNEWRFTLKDQYISDTIYNPYYDKDGDMYYRVIYANNLSEEVFLQSINYSTGINFRFELSNKFQIVISPALKISHFFKAKYRFNEGNLTYGAIYPAYSSDTIFSGVYDNYQNVTPPASFKNLKLLSTALSLDLSIYFSNEVVTNCWLSYGGFIGYGITNVQNHDVDDGIISFGPNIVNSTLYRNSELKLNRYGFFLGLTYSF